MHPSAVIAAENRLIERLAAALRYYGCGPDTDDLTGPREYDEQLIYADGHSGEGWYLGCSSYPDEGAEFIAPHEYGALLVAQTIVAEERAALAEEFLRELTEARAAYDDEERGALLLAGQVVHFEKELASLRAELADAKAVQACTEAWLDSALDEHARLRVEAAQRARQEPPLEPAQPAVMFEAQLVALGGARHLVEALGEMGEQTVLIFAATDEEARKTAPLFRKSERFTRLAAGGAL